MDKEFKATIDRLNSLKSGKDENFKIFELDIETFSWYKKLLKLL